jgi:hypothetical protein
MFFAEEEIVDLTTKIKLLTSSSEGQQGTGTQCWGSGSGQNGPDPPTLLVPYRNRVFLSYKLTNFGALSDVPGKI